MSDFTLEEMRGCEYEICDFCINYIDAGTKVIPFQYNKRGGFAGHGHCSIDYEETDAWMGCEEFFVCRVCQKDILKHWSCI